MGDPRGLVTGTEVPGNPDAVYVQGIPNPTDVHYPHLQTCTVHVLNFPVVRTKKPPYMRNACRCLRGLEGGQKSLWNRPG